MKKNQIINYREISDDQLIKLIPLLKRDFYLDDKKTRLLKYFRRIYHFSDEVKLYHYSGVVGSIKKISDGLDNEPTASGFSFIDEETALVKFIGEAIERFSQRVYKKKDFQSFAYKDIYKNAPNILKIARISSNQLKNPLLNRFIFNENTIFNWTTGFDIQNGKKVYIPAQLIYINYIYDKAEKIIYPSTTNGCAGGFTFYSAILRGIFEIIERDHFLITYLNKLSPPKIDLNSIDDPEIIELIDLIYKHRFKINLIDITLDLKVPTYLTVIIDETGIGPAISLGLKSHFNRKLAIIGSITEAFHPRCWIRRIVEDHPRLIKKVDPKKIITLRDRALYWFSKDKIKDIKFLLVGKTKKIENFYKNESNFNDKEMLTRLVKIFKNNNIRIYYKDITLPLIKKMGYYVIKVIIPEMVPFYLDERMAPLGAKRLYEVPIKLGYKKEVLESSFNMIPHPFL